MFGRKFIPVALLVVIVIGPAFATEPDKPCDGPYKNGSTPTKEQLSNIQKNHAEWIELANTISMASIPPGALEALRSFNVTNWEVADLSGIPAWVKSDKRRANLCGADLSGIDLSGSKLRFAVFRDAKLVRANFRVADLYGADFRQANLGGANLTEAKLGNADFRKAHIDGANLSRANLHFANLTGVKTKSVNFSGADLSSAKLINSVFTGAHFNGANLTYADLSGASVGLSDLSGAVLDGTNLTDAQLQSVDVNQTNLEPRSGWKPKFDDLMGWHNLSQMTYRDSPQGLVLIRKIFKDAGLREQEQQVTYAIKHTERQHANPIEGLFSLVLFELTSAWGMYPGRPLRILGVLILGFSLFYVQALIAPVQTGICRVWPDGRILKENDEETNKPPELLTTFTGIGIGVTNSKVLTYKKIHWALVPLTAIYFSILSAFHIGWRDLNLGNWIVRLQPVEFVLRPTGWVRLVSGVQSLISVYLIALSALTYFGRPFG